MTKRRGERLGWTLGWMGGFLWVAILAVVFLVQDRTAAALTGLAVAGLAACCIRWFAPWRRPATPYRQLMIPLYVVLVLAIIWAVWAYGGPEQVGLDWWSFLWLIPLLLPLLGPTSKRTWEEGATMPPENPNHKRKERHETGG